MIFQEDLSVRHILYRNGSLIAAVLASCALHNSAPVHADDTGMGAVAPTATAGEVSTDLIPQIRQLLVQGRAAEAYELALAQRAQREGETAFDAWYGLAALESGRPHEAQYAFERVLLMEPGNRRIQLELARSLYIQGNLDAAEETFTRVLETEPPKQVQNNIQAFLSSIETRREAQHSSLQGYLQSAAGYDSNINSATALNRISIGNIPVFIEETSREIESEFGFVGAGLTWLAPQSKRMAWRLRGDVRQRDYLENDDFDSLILGAEAAAIWAAGDTGRHQFTAGVRYQNAHLDGDEYQNAASLYGQWRWQGDAVGDFRWQLMSSLSYNDIRYPGDSLRDVEQGMLVFSSLLNAGPDHQHSIGVLYGDEQTRLSEAEHNAKDFYGLFYAWQWTVTASHQLFARAIVQDVEYEDIHPTFFEIREDEYYTATLGWQWQFDPQWQLSLEASYTDNHSNLDLFTYDRNVVEAGISYQF